MGDESVVQKPELPGAIKTTTTIETKPALPPAPQGSVETKVTVTQTSSPIREFGKWSAGLIAGFIGGGAHAIVSAVAFQYVDPVTAHQAIVRYGWLFVVHGIISSGIYLKNHPIPDQWNPNMPDRRSVDRGSDLGE